MAVNRLSEACISTVREVLVFWSPRDTRPDGSDPRITPKLHGRVQIIDVFSLEVATGFSRDPMGRLILHSKPSIAEARSWSLVRAAQLIRNDARPNRWVALHQDNRAWGLFWAGGGLQLCREHLAAGTRESDSCSALVPVNAEQILALVLNTRTTEPGNAPSIEIPASFNRRDLQLVAITSAAWLSVLMLVVAGFNSTLEQQNRKLEILLERTAPSSRSK